MIARSTSLRFSRLIGRLLERNLPAKVHLANEAGAMPGSQGVLPTLVSASVFRELHPTG